MLGVYILFEGVLGVFSGTVLFDGLSCSNKSFDFMIESQPFVVSIGVKEDVFTSSIGLVKFVKVGLKSAMRVQEDSRLLNVVTFSSHLRGI